MVGRESERREAENLGTPLNDPKSYFPFPGNALELDAAAALLMLPQVLHSQNTNGNKSMKQNEI